MSSSLTWTGATDTDLDNESNWSPADPPNSSDTITFNTLSNGGTLTGSASALAFAFNEPGPWVLVGATLTVAGQPDAPNLPFAGGFNTNVTLISATLNAAGGTTSIGDTDGATVTAQSGSTVTTEGDSVGTLPGQTGSLVLTDSGTSWTEQESGGSGGSLTVGGQGPTGSLGGSTGFLSVSNNASLVTQASATLGEDSGSQGFGTLTSGGVWSTNGLVLGQSGTGTLTIDSGGTLLNGGTFSAIGQDAGSTGGLVIDAGGSYVSSLAPQSSTFVLDIGDDGASGTLAPATGTALVTGSGATLNLNGNPLALGLNGGTGSLIVSDGGTAEVGTADSSDNPALSVGELGTGIATVTGAGSSLTTAGFAYIGRGGSGTLIVANDGIAQFGTDPTGAGGLDIGVGSSSAGQPIGGTGTAIVSNGGSLSSTQHILTGR